MIVDHKNVMIKNKLRISVAQRFYFRNESHQQTVHIGVITHFVLKFHIGGYQKGYLQYGDDVLSRFVPSVVHLEMR